MDFWRSREGGTKSKNKKNCCFQLVRVDESQKLDSSYGDIDDGDIDDGDSIIHNYWKKSRKKGFE